ncbi:MAG: 3-hydroxybutyrate dehydrogenase [Burkholderiaceae bacterium]
MLKNKLALVTGSTSGIGLATARALAAEGADIILNGFGKDEDIERERAGIAAEFNVDVRYDGTDLMDADAIERMFARITDSGRQVDILVNNAGIQHTDNVEDFPRERWDAIIALNLSAVFHTARFALPGMKRANWGRIINIASAHGKVASAQKSAYVAAKHAVVGLSKVIALETARTGVTCNAICPGWVLTPLVQRQIDARAEREGISGEQARIDLLSEKQPSIEFVTTEQIGAMAVYLCSPGADQVRGAAFSIDGGWTAQ